MKKDRVLILRELIVTQINHWILFLLALTLYGLLGREEPAMWQWGLCSLLPFAMYLARRFTNGFVVFVVSHILFVVPFWFIPHSTWVEKLIFMIYVIGYLCYSFGLRVKTKERQDGMLHPVFAVCFAGALLLLQNYKGNSAWEMYYVVAVVVFLAGHFLQLYLEQYQTFMIVNDSSKGRIPEKEMFRSGMTLVTFFAAAAGAVLYLTSGVGWLGQIMGMIGDFLLWLLRLLFRGNGEEVEEVPVQKPQTNVNRDKNSFMYGEAETGIFWIILEKIMMVALCVGAIALCIWAIYSLITFLHNRFGQKLGIGDEELEVATDVREKCEVERRKKERRSPFEFLSTRERIRRIYKKEVWAQRMNLVTDGSPSFLRLLTAREYGKKMDRGSLSESYEKARYSEQECTAEDVKRAKEK